MANHNIKITFTDEEEKFLKWLAKRDRVSVMDELKMIFLTEFRACEDLYMDEMKGEQE